MRQDVAALAVARRARDVVTGTRRRLSTQWVDGRLIIASSCAARAASPRPSGPDSRARPRGSPVARSAGSMARGGGQKGERNGAYRHGLHTAEAVAEQRAVTALLRRARMGLVGTNCE